MRARLSALAMLACLASAQAEPVHGRLQLQDVFASDRSNGLAAMLTGAARNDALGDLRLSWSPRAAAFAFDVAVVANADYGDGAGLSALEQKLAAFAPMPPATWWNLTDHFERGRHLAAGIGVDRLSLSYTASQFVVRVGRQALTWGAGLVFRPMDLFDPFAPDATDTEYKPGADMIYGQYLFADGSDLQAVIVPRPARQGGGLTTDASSVALRYHAGLGEEQVTALIARDHGDVTLGVGVNGPLRGATWNLEAVPTFVRGGGDVVSVLANLSDADKIAGMDVTWFGEYFRNGFGLSRRRYALAQLPAPLADRLVRGQLFDTGRDYVALGAQLQATPLLLLSPTAIANLNDDSLYLLGEANYSLADDLTLILGARLAVGPAGTEFGGIPVVGGVAPYLTQPARFYVQLRQYF